MVIHTWRGVSWPPSSPYNESASEKSGWGPNAEFDWKIENADLRNWCLDLDKLGGGGSFSPWDSVMGYGTGVDHSWNEKEAFAAGSLIRVKLPGSDIVTSFPDSSGDMGRSRVSISFSIRQMDGKVAVYGSNADLEAVNILKSGIPGLTSIRSNDFPEGASIVYVVGAQAASKLYERMVGHKVFRNLTEADAGKYIEQKGTFRNVPVAAVAGWTNEDTINAAKQIITPAPPEPEKKWWEQTLSFDEDGSFNVGPARIAPIDLGPWLEKHYLDKPLELIAKTAFYGVLTAIGGSLLWKLFTVVGSAIAAKWGTHIIQDIPRDSAVIVEKMINSQVSPASIAANPVIAKLMEIFGAKTPLRLMGKFVVGVAGIDIIASWLASDNVVTGTGFTMNRLKDNVEAGIITREQALDDIDRVQGWKDFATNFVNISTAVNPLLWAFRKLFMDNTKLAQQNIDDIKDQVEAAVPPTPPGEVPPGEVPPGEVPPGEVVPGKAWVTIKSNPIGAGIYIDGDYKFIKTNFQFLLAAREQPYFIQISAPTGYINPTGRSVHVRASVNQTIDFGDLVPLAPGEVPEPFLPAPIEVPLEPIKPPVVIPNAWKCTITARDADTENIVSAKIIINGTFTDKWTTNFIILEPSATYSMRLEAYGYETAEIQIITEALPT